jgi:hypothetical protein
MAGISYPPRFAHYSHLKLFRVKIVNRQLTHQS